MYMIILLLYQLLCFKKGVAELNKDWLKKDDKIQGFQWRGGTERVTVGIQIWSEPFITENKFGEKVSFVHTFKLNYFFKQVFHCLYI